MPKVSVIIPIYGVEAYIERCAKSLFEQTLDDIEYIFVNDCTIDRSIEILFSVLKNFPSRENQVKVFNMERNSGQAAVRRKGVELATGEYIIHCDSDDFVDRDMYSLMYEKAKEGGYDMVVSDLYEGNEDGWRLVKGKTSNSSDMLSDILMRFLSSLWNKMIKTDIAKNASIVFPVENTCEDLALIVQYTMLSKSIGYVPQPLYYYYRRSSSILGKRSPEAMLDKNRQMVTNFNIAIDAIERHGQSKKYKDAILHEKVWIKNQLLPVMPYKNCSQLWRNTYKEVNFKAIFSPCLTLKEKANFIITLTGLYPLYCKIRH